MVALSALGAPYFEQTAALLVDSFYPMFRGISPKREILRRFFMPCILPEQFYVLLKGGHVAGFIARSDAQTRALAIREDVCISMFGRIKGTILARQLHPLLGVPAVSGGQRDYIDFLATAPEYKRQGVAAALLSAVETGSDCTELYLDVLSNNAPAIRLYEKLGYHTECVKKSFLMRLAGIKPMYSMKKVLT